MIDPCYRLISPESATSCAVFNAAHSGSAFPASFLESVGLTLAELRSSEDAFVDQLIGCAPEFGGTVLAARFSRAYVDANRAATELDPALIAGLPPQKNNPRVAVGLGVLPRVVAAGKVIQRGKISLAEADKRLDQCYFPYHAALRDVIEAQKRLFGMCILFDFHSMPKDAAKSGPAMRRQKPDIILGDRFGSACDRWVIDAVEKVFVESDFSVVRNVPFAGGHITQLYGNAKKQVHAVQVEINRSLYMDEKRIEPLPDFDRFQMRINGVVERLANLGPMALEFAAE